MKYLLIVVFFCLIFQNSYGQILESTISKSEIKIGEPFELNYTIQTKTTDSIYFNVPVPFLVKESGPMQSIGSAENYELEMLQPFRDTQFVLNNKLIWQGMFVLTGWDSAYVVIPPMPVIVEDSMHYFDAQLINIWSPKADPSKEIFDIKELFSPVPSDSFSFLGFLKKNGWWIILILLLGGFIFWKIKTKNKRLEPVVELSLRDQIINEIDKLYDQRLYETNLKEYYFQLSVIIRKFLGTHYSIALMEYTTKEVCVLLKTHAISEDTIIVIQELLNKSDMVKFAKSEPPIHEVVEITNKARQIVDEVAELELNE
jgi:hypothetical protein